MGLANTKVRSLVCELVRLYLQPTTFGDSKVPKTNALPLRQPPEESVNTENSCNNISTVNLALRARNGTRSHQDYPTDKLNFDMGWHHGSTVLLNLKSN